MSKSQRNQTSRKLPKRRSSAKPLGSTHFFTGLLFGCMGLLAGTMSDTGEVLRHLSDGLASDVEAHEISRMTRNMIRESCSDSLGGISYEPGSQDPIENIRLRKTSLRGLGSTTVLEKDISIGDFKVESIQLIKNNGMKDGKHLASLVMNLRKLDGTLDAGISKTDTRLTQVFPIYIETDAKSHKITQCGDMDEYAARKPATSDESAPSPVITGGEVIEITPVQFEDL